MRKQKPRVKKLEARLYGYDISTENFGDFEMFSWMGDVQIARKLIIKASKRFKIKIIEGGYKPKDKIFLKILQRLLWCLCLFLN